VQLLTSSLSRSFDQSVVAAVRGVGAAGLLPPRPRGVGRHARYRLEVETVGDADTTHDWGDTVGTVRMRWIGTRIPVWSSAVLGATVPGHQWVPYPAVADRQRVEDSLLVQFVVGADGRIVPGTAYLYHAGYKDFVWAVSDRLKSLQFVPTTIGGCPVASLARESFTFKIRP